MSDLCPDKDTHMMLEFVEDSIKTVATLVKRANAAEEEVATLRAKVRKLEEQPIKKVATAKPSLRFKPEDLSEVCQLLQASGQVKSAAAAAVAFEQNPNALVDVIKTVLLAPGEEGEFTTLSTQAPAKDLWAAALR